MKWNMKFVLSLLCSIYGHFSNGQNLLSSNDSIANYSLTISTFNHADDTWFGIKTYQLTNSVLTITKHDSILLTKTIDETSISLIRNIKTDDLKDYYFNNCVMTTSGNEYFVTIIKNDVKQSISLHHYYQKEIEMLINEMNKQIPDELKIAYMKSDEKQDCKL